MKYYCHLIVIIYGNAMVQAAALPFRILPGVANMAGEAIDVLLVTSRDTGRWVLPKGNIESGETASAAAEREAAEEAGVSGVVAHAALGSYRYAKRDSADDDLDVTVYALRVREMASDWPERKERERQWFPLKEASDLVEEPELATLIAGFRG
jgi:hypothetical protein